MAPTRYLKMKPLGDGTYKRMGPSYTKSKYSGRKRYQTNKTKNPFNAKVEKVLARHLESKYKRETIASEPATTLWNSIISTQNDWYRCLPLIGRGQQSHQRIGDQISPTKLTVNFSFRFDTNEQNTRDIFIVLYIVQPKSSKDYLTDNPGGALPSNWNQYLDNGDDTTTYYQGTWADAQKPINKENFTLLHKKVIPLLKGSGKSNGSGVVPSSDGMYTHERSVRSTHSYTFKSVPKLLYSDVSLLRPANFSPVWAVGYYYGDGTAADRSTGILDVACESHLYYKDG